MIPPLFLYLFEGWTTEVGYESLKLLKNCMVESRRRVDNQNVKYVFDKPTHNFPFHVQQNVNVKISQ